MTEDELKEKLELIRKEKRREQHRRYNKSLKGKLRTRAHLNKELLK